MRFRGSIRGWASTEFFHTPIDSDGARKRAVRDSRRYMMQLMTSDDLRRMQSERERRKGKVGHIVRLQNVISRV